MTTHAKKAPLTTAEQLHELSRATRSRRNLEKIQTLLEEVKENAAPVEDWGSEIRTLNDAVSSVREQTENIDNTIMPSQYVSKVTDALDTLDALLPGDDDPALELSNLIDEALSHAEDYESMLDDRDLSAEDREDKWAELQESLTAIGDGLDTLQTLGTDKQPEESANDE